jgi:D-tagatose-1,6-bisphosphate aldolase subunit GatZ/KbaZ
VAEENSKGEQRFYVIGTEVPTPGGATESLENLAVTTRDAAEKTLKIHHDAFEAAGIERVWPRVIALVVQPGVEFNHDTVIHYISEKTVALRGLLTEADGLVFEAHSTDYQVPQAYENLVRDGFAILKVGPALTFAMREGLFALAQIEEELVGVEKRSRLAEVLEAVMLDRPVYWEKHYDGTPEQQRVLRRFSYSDRVRYYWTEPRVRSAAETLLRNLQGIEIPQTLLSSFLPDQYRAIRQGLLRPCPYELILDRIQQVIRPYAAACYGARN